jgi:hypothetical protein
LDVTVLTDEGVETIHTTDHHRFWSESRKQWIEAKFLVEAERLLTIDGKVVTVVDAAVIPQGVCWGIPAVGSLGVVLVDGGRGCGGGSFFGSVGASGHGDLVGVVDESVEDGFGDDGVREEWIPVFGFAV